MLAQDVSKAFQSLRVTGVVKSSDLKPQPKLSTLDSQQAGSVGGVVCPFLPETSVLHRAIVISGSGKGHDDANKEPHFRAGNARYGARVCAERSAS